MMVYELMDLFIDDAQSIELYDTDKEEIIYSGEYVDLPEEMENYEVCSIDNVYKGNPGIVTLNVEVE